MNEWISVEDELPIEGMWVIGATYLNNGEYIAKELFFDSQDTTGHCYWLSEGDWENKVTHWMKLPDAPK